MEMSWKPDDYRSDLRATAAGGPQAIALKQGTRLAAMVAFARANSQYYRDLYRDVPVGAPLEAFPTVNKVSLMEHFDRWVTDPRVTRSDVEPLFDDPARLIPLYLGRYSVSKTSGSNSTPAIILQDAEARGLYDAIYATRGWLGLKRYVRESLGYVRYGFRHACVLGSTDYPLATGQERIRRKYPWLASRFRTFTLRTPLTELVAQLNAYRPTHLITYPSVALVLARQQQAGHLHLHPVNLFTGAETLELEARAEIENAFGCRIRDIYNSNEFPGMAFDCHYHCQHLNTDWLILEPVDREGHPVSAGQPSHSALLTNLVNRVQPFIRYEMGDSVTVRSDPCPCGSPFPAIRVVGRTGEILSLVGPDQRGIDLSWVFFGEIINSDKRVARWQILQVAPDTLRIRLDTRPGCDAEDVWAVALQELQAALAGQGLPELRLERASEIPEINPATGKYRRVWRAYD